VTALHLAEYLFQVTGFILQAQPVQVVDLTMVTTVVHMEPVVQVQTTH
jgi:hypothetical protein